MTILCGSVSKEVSAERVKTICPKALCKTHTESVGEISQLCVAS